MSEDLLNSLLLIWQEQLDQGTDLSAVELCRQHQCPELADDLEERIVELRHMNALAGPGPSISTVATLRPSLDSSISSGENRRTAPSQTETVPLHRAVEGYEVLAFLGRGGMGVVYKARHLKLNRIVALKMILAGDHAAASVRARFLVEAEAAAALHHRHIVALLEYGEHQGLPFFTMEFIAGGSLADRLRGAPQSAMEAASLIEQLARGIHYAHTKGIVHRDLKPSNVLLTEDGIPKINDFGLARRVEADTGLTGSGDVLGTPSYMAPEQAGGQTRTAGPAADVYALGAILYECLTGRPPFRAATAVETLMQVVGQEPVSVQHLQPRIPVDLVTICHKCLLKEPHHRYASALELAEDLRRFLEGRPIEARPVGRLERLCKWARRNQSTAWLYGVIVLAVVAIIGLGFWFSAHVGAARGQLAALSAEKDLQVTRAAAEAAEAEQSRRLAAISEYYRLINQIREQNQRKPAGWTTTGLEHVRKAAALTPGPQDLLDLRSLAAECLGGVTLRERARVPTIAPRALAFHPDGRTLAIGQHLTQLWNKCTVALVDVDRGEVTSLLETSGSTSWQTQRGTRDGINCLTCSPDGRWLLAGMRSGQLHRWDLKDANPTVHTWQGHGEGVQGLCFRRDSAVLYSLTSKEVKRWEVQTGKESAVYQGKDVLRNLTSRPISRSVECLEGNRWLSLREGRLTPTGPLRELRASVVAVNVASHTLFVAEGRHLRLVVPNDLEVLRHFRLPGRETASVGEIGAIELSPDGTSLAVASDDGHVCLWDIASARPLAEVNVENGNARVAFAPDGRTLAVSRERDTILYDVSAGDVRSTAAMQPRPIVEIAWFDTTSTLACLVQNDLSHSVLTFWGFDRANNLVPDRAHREPRILKATRASNPRLAIAPGGAHAALARDKDIALLSPVNGWLGRDWITIERLATMQFGPDGKLWAGARNEVTVWTTDQGAPVAKWSNWLSDKITGRGVVRSVRVGRRHAAVGILDGTIKLLDANHAREIASRPVGKGAVQSIDFDRAEDLALFGTDGGAVGLLRLSDGAILSLHDVHRDSVMTVAFLTPDLVATGSDDHTVRLWRVADDRLHEVLTLSFTGPVVRVAETMGGTRLAVLVEGERAVRLWRLDRLRTRLADLSADPGF